MTDQGKLRWRCRRGMKELDVLLERYLADRYSTASPAERMQFAALVELEDPVLQAWLLKGEAPEAAFEAVVSGLLTIPTRI
jgi:antitoxin CptB